MSRTAYQLTLQEQIAYVRRYGEGVALRIVGVALLLLCLLAIVGFVRTDNETAGALLLFVAGMSGMVALVSLLFFPKFKRAAHATRTGRRVEGVLQLTIDDSDSDATRYRGLFRDGDFVWRLDFSKPMGWSPAAGDWPCRLVFLSDTPKPVLALLDEGLLMIAETSSRARERHD